MITVGAVNTQPEIASERFLRTSAQPFSAAAMLRCTPSRRFFASVSLSCPSLESKSAITSPVPALFGMPRALLASSRNAAYWGTPASTSTLQTRPTA